MPSVKTHAEYVVCQGSVIGLNQQTATGEILRVISSSPTDVQPGFQTIAESAVRLSGALFGFVYRFDGELIHMVAHHNYPAAALEFSQRSFPTPPNRQVFTRRCDSWPETSQRFSLGSGRTSWPISAPGPATT